MTVYVVTKTLYAADCHLCDDFGNHVNCLSELIGVFTTEDAARDAQERTYNKSPYDTVSYGINMDRHETYIDVTIEEASIRG